MLQNDFDDEVVEHVAHRPWPMPGGPWVMTQTWHDLLFAHWPVAPTDIAARVPAPLELDTFDGRAWIGLVPFRMTNVAPRGVPALPWLSAFPELNVRTYVRLAGRPGVYFFSLDAANPLAVMAARTLFSLPYHVSSMRVEADGRTIRYSSRRVLSRGSSADLRIDYRPTGPVFHPAEGSLEYFLTERYCLYTVRRPSTAYTVEIHHPRWRLQPAACEIAVNTIVPAAAGVTPAGAPLVHFSKRQDMVGWWLRRWPPSSRNADDPAGAAA